LTASSALFAVAKRQARSLAERHPQSTPNEGQRFHWDDLEVDTGTTASAGAGVAFMDEPKGLKEFVLTADSTARAAWYFLLFAARYSLTSAFLISITASPIIGGLLEKFSSRAKRGQLKATGQHCYL
jgi:ABC-type dipeptide/oligopeptide/nickel transport system permease subunit